MINVGGLGLSNALAVGGRGGIGPLGMGNYLIRNGMPVGATFQRPGDVETIDDAVFPADVPAKYDGGMIHHGQVSALSPAYDVSPLKRPIGENLYASCASGPNPSKVGLNWEFSDPKNGWVWDLLDGRADGVELLTPGILAKTIDAENRIIDLGNGFYRFIQSATGSTIGDIINILTAGVRYESLLEVTEYTDGGGTGGVKCVDSLGASTWGILAGIGRDVRRAESPGTQYRTTRRVPSVLTDLVFRACIQAISPATGTLNLKGLSAVPAVTEWQTTGDFNILSGDDDTATHQIIYIEPVTGLICAKDSGGNICKSPAEYVAGSDTDAVLLFSADGKMRIDMPGLIGTEATFSGHFKLGVTLKWGLGNEDVFVIKNVSGEIGLATMPATAVI